MASIENSLRYEAEVGPGKIRLITSGVFVRANNYSAWLFYCSISKYKVMRKCSKVQQKDVYFLGFPVSKLLELTNGRVCEKTDFWYDITQKLEEIGEVTCDRLRFYPEWMGLLGCFPCDRSGRRRVPSLPVLRCERK